MLARLFTWIFYAVVFFSLGAWTGKHYPSVGVAVEDGAAASVDGLKKAWRWAFDRTSEKPAPKAAAVSQPAPATEPAEAKAETKAETEAPTEKADKLADAREAYNKGAINDAIATYQDYLAENPGDIDSRGELGNVYFAAGRLEEAATVFYDVATRLIANGDGARAKALEPAIRRGNPSLADELRRRLTF